MIWFCLFFLFILLLLDSDDFQFVVFAHHTIMLDAICELLKAKKTNFVRIDGNVSAGAFIFFFSFFFASQQK
jgi:hypothetical protein